MMGEELNATEITQRGLLGDRAYALVDNPDGKVAIGGEVRLNITGPCSRCVMTTLPQGDLPKSGHSAHDRETQQGERRSLCRGAARRNDPAR